MISFFLKAKSLGVGFSGVYSYNAFAASPANSSSLSSSGIGASFNKK